jgi:hypothetical protein
MLMRARDTVTAIAYAACPAPVRHHPSVRPC